MKEYLLNQLQQSGSLSFEEILLNLLVAAVIGLVIYISYSYTHAGTVYSKKFNVSLLMLTILTATVMTVIGNNLALSLGMVGALSIVRFRTAIKDTRDTVYVFWTIIVGICCGARDYLIAALGTAIVFVLLLFLGRVKNDDRVLLIIRGGRFVEKQIESVIFNYYKGKAQIKVKNTSKDSVEIIYQLSKKVLIATQKYDTSITDLVYQIDSIEYVNIVTQSDEING